ncbi:enoyl-CoA hydratase/isomerase family protein [Jiangella asiatica]|uniref:enoyl-CoA hydratase/isomerase family protein n=1 Tax=Jiangella asiatica TaxID=2530372 RepID=UPI0023B07FC3|nr:enoyl-CoA hydratase-related protein [Jiangella asiatica]
MGRFTSVARRDGVGVIRIDRPPLNVLSTAVQDELADVAAQVAHDASITAAIIWGGPKTFAAGADVKEMEAMDVATLRARPEGLQHGFNQLAALRKPLIAAITGYALGGGCELALTADLRVAADNAVLGQPEVTLGMIPGCGGTQRLARLVGPSRAKDLMLTGRRVDADEALRIGLADRVVPAPKVFDTAFALAADLAAGPALAYQAICTAVDDGLDRAVDDGLALERELFAKVFGSEDKAIGTRHFVMKHQGRAPFVGR